MENPNMLFFGKPSKENDAIVSDEVIYELKKLIKQYCNDLSNRKLREEIENIGSKIIGDKFKNITIESNKIKGITTESEEFKMIAVNTEKLVKDSESILKIINEANKKISNDDCKIRPTLKDGSFASKLDSDGSNNFSFEYWTIQDYIFDDFLGGVEWKYATLKNVTFGASSYYVLSNIANAESIEDIKFLNPKGVGDINLSNTMALEDQVYLLYEFHDKILLKRKNRKQKDEIKQLKEENKRLKEENQQLKDKLEHIDSTDSDDGYPAKQQCI